MLPVTVTLQLAAANAANIVASNTPAGAGALTLVSPTTIKTQVPLANGASQIISTPTVTLDVARRVLVTFGNEASNRTITITGGDRYGEPISETLTVASGASGTIATQQDFLTITAVTVYAAWTAAMTVGTNTFGSTPWVVVQNNVTPFNISYQFAISGTVTCQIDVTEMNPLLPLPAGLIVPDFNNPTGLSSVTTSSLVALTDPIVAWRMTVSSGTGAVRLTAQQTGNWQ